MDKLDLLLDALEKSRLIHNQTDQVELSHDSLAKEIAGRRSDREKAIITWSRLVRDKYKLSERTNTEDFLTGVQLSALDDWLEELTITKAEREFVEKSRKAFKAARNKKRIKRTILFVGVLVFICSLTALTLFTRHEMKLVEEANERIQEEKNRADSLMQETEDRYIAIKAERDRANNAERARQNEADLREKDQEALVNASREKDQALKAKNRGIEKLRIKDAELKENMDELQKKKYDEFHQYLEIVENEAKLLLQNPLHSSYRGEQNLSNAKDLYQRNSFLQTSMSVSTLRTAEKWLTEAKELRSDWKVILSHKQNKKWSTVYTKIKQYEATKLKITERLSLEENQLLALSETLRFIDKSMVVVETQRALRGCTDRRNNCEKNAREKHYISIHPYRIAKYEIRQKDWEAIMLDNPSSTNCPTCPVDNVSWLMVEKFIKKLNGYLGVDRYRLPTEAEWEYAARGGKKSAKDYKYAGGDVLSQVAYWNKRGTNKVGRSGRANKLGLFDMSGNVMEWCSDWYGEDYYKTYKKNPLGQPKGPRDGKHRILRGGSFRSAIEACHTFWRMHQAPKVKRNDYGFRLARNYY